MNADSYDIQELVEHSGVSRRNIYFYIQQGLLPPAEGAGLGARYTSIHRLRLELIPLLRRQGLRLDEIRTRLGGLGQVELEELLSQFKHLAPPSPGNMPGNRPVPSDLRQEGQPCTVYTFPGGIQLIVPGDIRPQFRRVAERLLREMSLYGVPDTRRSGGQTNLEEE